MFIRKAAMLAGLALALVALSPASALSAQQEKTRTVEGTMKIAIFESSESANQIAGRFQGKPLGTAAVLGEVALTNTATGLVTEGRPVLYTEKGTVNLKVRDVVEFQPDGSISLNGTFEVVGGSGTYKGATGGGTFNASLPARSSVTVGTVVTFDVDGKIRY
jgi:hypothetical protein